MTAKRPNVLLITSDQQHPAALGCLDPRVRTPNLDALAASGTRFSRAYCPNPTCTPTRASMITGLYPSQHGAWSLGTGLKPTVPTVGDRLQVAGYDVALIGKAHFQPLVATVEHPSLEAYPTLQDLDFWRGFHGPFFGFNHVELARNHGDEAHVGQHYALWMEEKGAGDWRRHFRPPTGSTPAQYGRWSLPLDLHLNTWIAERTMARLERARAEDEPFFVWASFFDPHPPYLVPAPYDTMYDPASLEPPAVHPGEHAANPRHFGLTQEPQPDFSAWQETPMANHGFHSHVRSPEQRARDLALYFGMITCMDDAIGRILGRLEALGLAEDTLVVFTSDHGHFLGQHGLVAKGPFHYEDVLRVPFLVRWPGRVPAGRSSPALQSLVDLAPTVLEAAGEGAPASMAGRSQLPVWRGEAERVRDHVLVENRHQPTALHLETYVDRRHKLTVYRNSSDGELFDLEEDPGERRNLWHEPAAQALKAELLLRFVQARMAAQPLPMPRVAVA